MGIGVKVYVGSKHVHLVLFLSSTRAATAPASLVALETYEGAIVSGLVASLTKSLPFLRGIMVIPSGHFPSQ